MRRGVVALGAAGLGIAVGLISLAIVANEPLYAFSGTSTPGRVALLAAGWALLGAGLGSWLRSPTSRFGPLLAAAGFGWFLLEWYNRGAGSAFAFTAGLVLYASCFPLVGHAALAYRAGRLSSPVERAVVAAAYGASLVVLGLLRALFYDPTDEGCFDCPRNLLLVTGLPSTVDTLERIGVWLGAATVFSLALLVGLRLARASSAAARTSISHLCGHDS